MGLTINYLKFSPKSRDKDWKRPFFSPELRVKDGEKQHSGGGRVDQGFKTM